MSEYSESEVRILIRGLGINEKDTLSGALSHAQVAGLGFEPRTFRLHRAASATVRCEFESENRGLGPSGRVSKGGLQIYRSQEPG
jgi:hypothetical protein